MYQIRSEYRSSSRLIYVLIVAVAALCLAPNRLQASCGDYVMVGGSEPSAHSQNDPIKPESPSKPCTGPFCKSNQPKPTLPPATTVSILKAKAMPCEFIPAASIPIDRWATVSALKPPFDSGAPPVPPPR